MESNKDKEAAATTQLLAFGIGSLLLGGIGYLIGKGKYTEWDDFIKKYNKRWDYLLYFKVIIPVVSLNTTKMWQVYREGIDAYLFGLPNASIPMVFKCLEIGMRSKYSEVEKKNGSSVNTYGLIEWAKTYLGNRKEIAHGFRILRNILHEKKNVEEQDALENIRHISKILTLLYPFPIVYLKGKCVSCGKPYITEVEKDNYYMGNTIYTTRCGGCQQVNKVMVV